MNTITAAPNAAQLGRTLRELAPIPQPVAFRYEVLIRDRDGDRAIYGAAFARSHAAMTRDILADLVEELADVDELEIQVLRVPGWDCYVGGEIPADELAGYTGGPCQQCGASQKPMTNYGRCLPCEREW